MPAAKCVRFSHGPGHAAAACPSRTTACRRFAAAPHAGGCVRWAADHSDLDTAATIAVYATLLGLWVYQQEPVGWAEELLEPAQAVEHRWLAQLYVMAAQCYGTGRIEGFLRYADASRAAIDSGRYDPVAHEFESAIGLGYVVTGQPHRWVELCSAVIARTSGSRAITQACLVSALTAAGAGDEAVAASEGLLAVADATDNPLVACLALFAYSYAQSGVDPARLWRRPTGPDVCSRQWEPSDRITPCECPVEAGGGPRQPHRRPRLPDPVDPGLLRLRQFLPYVRRAGTLGLRLRSARSPRTGWLDNAITAKFATGTYIAPEAGKQTVEEVYKSWERSQGPH